MIKQNYKHCYKTTITFLGGGFGWMLLIAETGPCVVARSRRDCGWFVATASSVHLTSVILFDVFVVIHVIVMGKKCLLVLSCLYLMCDKWRASGKKLAMDVLKRRFQPFTDDVCTQKRIACRKANFTWRRWLQWVKYREIKKLPCEAWRQLLCVSSLKFDVQQRKEVTQECDGATCIGLASCSDVNASTDVAHSSTHDGNDVALHAKCR